MNKNFDDKNFINVYDGKTLEFEQCIPLHSDGTILISTLNDLIPNCQNLKYKYFYQIKEGHTTVRWEPLKIFNNRLHPPSDGWKSRMYYSIKTAISYKKKSTPIYGNLMARMLCSTFTNYGFCESQLENTCNKVHGDLCDICNLYALHPFSITQRAKHIKECINKQIKEQRKSDLFEKIQDKTCAICLDIIGQSDPYSLNIKPFGLLENCQHVFCLECIEEWRKDSDELNEHNRKRCPVCRVMSDVVISSNTLIEDNDKNVNS